MAGSRDPLRDLPEVPPARDLAVAPTRVGSGRSGRGAAVALASVVAAIAIAIALAQAAAPPPARPLDPAPPSPGGSPSDAGIAAGTGVATATPTALPAGAAATRAEGTPPRLGRDELRDRVLDGTLDGRLVFVDGVLDATPARCQSLAQASGGCVDLSIGGLGLPVWAGAVAIPWRGDPPPGSWLVTVARPGGLVYLGALVPDPTVPETVADLADRLRRGVAPAPSGTLFEVPGWLVVDQPAGRGATAAPFLAADEPTPEGVPATSRGAAVDLASPVVEVDRAAAVTPGTFLLAPPDGCRPGSADESPGSADETCRPGAAWLVVARYEPARAVRVLVP